MGKKINVIASKLQQGSRGPMETLSLKILKTQL